MNQTVKNTKKCMGGGVNCTPISRPCIEIDRKAALRLLADTVKYGKAVIRL